MIKFGKLVLDGTPKIAVPFGDKVPPSALADANRLGMDIAELRIDRYSQWNSDYVLREIEKFKQFPTLATIRSRKEGGSFGLSEERRLALFKEVIAGVDAIDIELSSGKILSRVIAAARQFKKTVMVSYHNFNLTPPVSVLNKLLRKAHARGADIVKIAAMACGKKDIQRLGQFTVEHAKQNIVVIAMGREASLSRVFFPALGSLITYASFGKSMAPGQLSLQQTAGLLRLLAQ